MIPLFFSITSNPEGRGPSIVWFVAILKNPSDDQSIGRSVYLCTALLLIRLGDCRLFALCPRHIPTKRRDGGHPCLVAWVIVRLKRFRGEN